LDLDDHENATMWNIYVELLRKKTRKVEGIQCEEGREEDI
jgi:hypothetical protein